MRYAALPSVWIGAFQVLDEHFVGINSLVGKDATMVVLIECGGVAEWFRQGPAKPCTGVRIPSPPPTCWVFGAGSNRTATAILVREGGEVHWSLS